MAKFSNIIEG